MAGVATICFHSSLDVNEGARVNLAIKHINSYQTITDTWTEQVYYIVNGGVDPRPPPLRAYATGLSHFPLCNCQVRARLFIVQFTSLCKLADVCSAIFASAMPTRCRLYLFIESGHSAPLQSTVKWADVVVMFLFFCLCLIFFSFPLVFLF